MRRLQVQGQPGFPRQYAGVVDCTSQMLRQEGVASLWRGSLSSFAKVLPSIDATRCAALLPSCASQRRTACLHGPGEHP